MASGVTAKLLHVDLTARTTRTEELPEPLVRRYLGGGAMAAHLLLREMTPGVDPLGPDGQVGTLDDDLRLAAGSPCVDAGDNARVPADWLDLDGDGDTSEPLPLDLDGAARFQDDPGAPDVGAGTPPLVDMGALERAP